MSSLSETVSSISEFLSNLVYSKNQSVDEQTLYGKEQESSDPTMENQFLEHFENPKACLEYFNKRIGNYNKQHGIGNGRKKTIKNEIQSNLKKVEWQNLIFVWNLTNLLVFIDNNEKSDIKSSEKSNSGCFTSGSSSSKSSQSESYQRESKKPEEFEDEDLKKMKTELNIEQMKILEDASKRQQEYLKNMSSTSQDFLKKMKEQSHLEVRTLKTESYRQKDIKEFDKEVKNFRTEPKNYKIHPKKSDNFSEKLDGNNSKMGIYSTDSRDSREIRSELVLKPSVTTAEIQNEMKVLEIRHQNKMDQIKLESAENLKKSEMEFREKLAKKEEEREKELRELDREIEEFEKETKRLIEEKYLEIRKMNLAYFQCLFLQKKWETNEKEFNNFLDSIREPISRLKTRFSLFEKVLKTQKSVKNKVLRRELNSLHGSTYFAYQSVYKGWENIKKLSETFSDRIFLFISLKILVNVSDKLFNTLRSIDNCKVNEKKIQKKVQKV